MVFLCSLFTIVSIYVILYHGNNNLNHYSPKQKRSDILKKRDFPILLLISINITIFIAYITPYIRINNNEILAGYPFPWFSIYNFQNHNSIFRSSLVNLINFSLNIVIIYFLLSFIKLLFYKYFKKKS